MKIDGIVGEGSINPLITDKEYYNDWIEVQQYSIGMHMPESPVDNNTGKASFNDLFIKKHPDKASHDLAMACSTGRKIKSITIDFYKINPFNDRKIQKYSIFKFNECQVSSWYQNSMTVNQMEEQSPIEQVAFNYEKIELTYLNEDESPEEIRRFDLKTNKSY